MALAGIELRYIVDRLSGQIDGYYVNNIYGITKNSILFKLHHTTKDDIFLMMSTYGIWTTSTKMGQIEENRLQRRLRTTLLRMKMTGIRQIGAERIVYVTFEGFGSEFVLVVELFGDGNMILCSKENMKVLALLHSVKVRHRTLGVGSEYAPPPPPAENAIDIFDMSRGDFDGLAGAEIESARWLGRTLGLPKKYAEGIMHAAGIAPKTPGQQLDESQISAVSESAKKMIADVVSGNHTPVIVNSSSGGAKSEALPILMKGGTDATEYTPVSSFMEGLDSVYTTSLIKMARDAGASGSASKIHDLQTQITEQQRAVDTVMRRSDAISGLARSLVGLVSSHGILSMSDVRVAPVLEESGAMIVKEKGVHILRISDMDQDKNIVGSRKIPVNMQAPLQSVASALFDEAKRQARAAPGIQKIMEDAQRRLDRLQAKATSDRSVAGETAATEIRKKSWFERYRWFRTSDGSLAVGGRDAASNSAVVRKQMGKDDRVFHAEVHGSPFFLLKDAINPSDVSMNEVAHATVCFSRAWREGMHGMSAFWVAPSQVKKSAPTGQFLPKGSFTIQGQRNFIRPNVLRLAVGVVCHNGDHVLVCGPAEPVISHSIIYCTIEPHGSDLAEAAKRVRMEFLKLDEDVTKKIPLDDFVRVLPSGKSQVKHVGRGGAVAADTGNNPPSQNLEK